MAESLLEQKYRRMRGDAGRVLRDHLDMGIDEVAACAPDSLTADVVRSIEAGAATTAEQQQAYLKAVKANNWDHAVHKAALLLGSYGATESVGLGPAGMEFLLQLPPLGTMLRGIRQAEGLLQEDVIARAKEIAPDQDGFSPANLSKIENNRHSAVPFKVIETICRGFGMPEHIENAHGWVISEYIRLGLMPLDLSIKARPVVER